MEILNLQPGERVLLVGVGTGEDLPLLPTGISATGIDLSPDMLAKARKKLPLPGRDVTLLQGDAQHLLVDEAGFDAVVFNLVLSVITDGKACFRENLRALKPGGRAVVFDKFLPDEGRLNSMAAVGEPGQHAYWHRHHPPLWRPDAKCGNPGDSR